MADDSTIIEGTVKFRDGKKWKSRWCVMRKLSPVADCVHLQLYRDARSRYNAAAAAGGVKAALSLQQFLGAEAGFTLDKHSNTLALICRDLVAILAFETRERLIQWQVKVNLHLGEARQYLVVLGAGAGTGGGKRLPAGPARLLLHERRCALTAGVPPRLLGEWQLQHLRRYGVVEGKFCFEGGSHCGAGEGLFVLTTDQAAALARDFELAAQGRLSPRRRPQPARAEGAESPKSTKAFRPDTRLSELNAGERSLPADLRLEDTTSTVRGAGSPWGSAERDGDTASVHGEWASGVALERCMSCMSKLGALSRSSTAATPGTFNPAWTMDALQESDAPPRPPKPTRLEPGRPPEPLRFELGRPPAPPPNACCQPDDSKVGPYENYDVPKAHPAEVEGKYYDTPKRLKECLNEELFKITKSTTSNAIILKKPCGCLLKFGKRRREATVVEAEEGLEPANCPCRRVTDWAHSWIKLPYCRKASTPTEASVPNKENVTPNSDRTALYATIDVSRKTKRKASLNGEAQNAEVDDGPLANYENLSFALSLEHYENARALLRKAGVTQAELDAISANLRPIGLPARSCTCSACRQPTSEYLLMEPGIEPGKLKAPSGYTPMSPISGFAFHTLRLPARAARNLGEEKSASNPALCPAARAALRTGEAQVTTRTERARVEYRKRSSSADSSRFLEDVKEFEGSAGSRGSSSSVETLRARVASPCGCHKLSDADSSEASKARAAAPGAAGNRDSSSSNDSGVSSSSRAGEFELPLTTAAARRHYRSARRAALPAGTTPPRRTRSSDAPRLGAADPTHKSSSAEAEVPLLSLKGLRGVLDTHSSSSGASDMSDYIETLSICSSHSSSDTPVTMRAGRQCASVLRPRSGKEYQPLGARLAATSHLYSNLP
ncbi:uncharacterized protein LOC134797820 [Cydia splendana]|uniref:uncharacterized protein LOC134797820 n=1 Tax=Cydia splendana TaxID=1100963 RepID=UPI00300D5176